MENIGFPLILMGIIWGVFMPILKVIEMLNERRDKIIGPEPGGFPVAHRRHMLSADWLVIAFGATVFFVLIFFLFLIAPDFVKIQWVTDHAWAIRAVTVIVGIAFFVVGIRAGRQDYNLMKDRLSELENNQKAVRS